MDTTTALAFVIKDSKSVDLINSIREKHDRAFKRWPPHVNFIFPFVPTSQFDTIRTKLEKLNLQSFDVSFDTIGYFSQGKNCTIHLKCSNESTEKNMANVFAQITKACPEIEIKRAEFHPHLTLGQCKKSELKNTITSFNKELGLNSNSDNDNDNDNGSPLTLKFDTLEFLSRSPETNDKMVSVMTLNLA